MAQALTLQAIQPKLRVVNPKPAEKDTPLTKAYQSSRVTSLEGGLNVNLKNGGLIKYADISMLLAFRLDIDPDTWYLELFVYGQPQPFRLPQKAINYRQFLPDLAQRSKENFQAFLLYLINQAGSVYVDEQTLEFMRSGKIATYPDYALFEDYTRQLWFQLSTWMKFQCDNCGEVYWVDDAKISPQGAKTKCVKCQQIITVKKAERPQPLKPREERKTVACPHCRYENAENAQFCVMCQKPMVDFTAKPKPPLEAETVAPPPAETLESAPALEPEKILRADAPLQARVARAPRHTFKELADGMQDDLNTLEDKFAWFTQFARITQFLGAIFLLIGIFTAAYIAFIFESAPPLILTSEEQRLYAVAAFGIGLLLFLGCIVTSNLIALNLAIERHTNVTNLLLQRLLAKYRDE